MWVLDSVIRYTQIADIGPMSESEQAKAMRGNEQLKNVSQHCHIDGQKLSTWPLIRIVGVCFMSKAICVNLLEKRLN